MPCVDTSNGSDTTLVQTVFAQWVSGFAATCGNTSQPKTLQKRLLKSAFGVLGSAKRIRCGCFALPEMDRAFRTCRRFEIAPRCLPSGGDHVCGCHRTLFRLARFLQDPEEGPWAGGNKTGPVLPAGACDISIFRSRPTMRGKHTPFRSTVVWGKRLSQAFHLNWC